MSIVITTAGQVSVSERIEFFSKAHINKGDTIELKPTKPRTAPVYGQAYVLDYLGDGKQAGHHKYVAVRIN